MRLEMIGISHRSSSIDVREKASMAGESLTNALTITSQSSDSDGIVILSTCNRTEIYLSPIVHHDSVQLRQLFRDVTKLSVEESDQAYIMKDDAAVDHIFRVASGLDSQMLGEVQILGQIKKSLESAREEKTVNNILNKVFGHAVECGKLIRTKTELSRGAVSVASAAVQLAGRVFGNLENRNVLLVGAGETSRLASRHLNTAGVKDWRVSNRTEKNAKVISDLLGGEIVSFPPSIDDLIWADIVVSATSSEEPVIKLDTYKQAVKKRKSIQLLLDLAIPRDIDPEIRSLNDTYLYTVDDFNDLVEANLRVREKEAERASRMVQKEVDSFSACIVGIVLHRLLKECRMFLRG